MSKRNRFFGAAVVGVVFMLCGGAAAFAAIMEIDLRQGIANSVAVMRYLYKQRQDAERNIKMVEYSIKVTKEQLEAQRSLIERETASADPENVKKVKLDYFGVRLAKLEQDLQEMTRVDFEALFHARIEEITAEMEMQQVLMDAKLAEYRVHFGGEPPVNLEFQEKMSRFRPVSDTPGILDVR